MIRHRLVTVLTFNDGILFRTKNFVPDYRYTANFVDAWSVDEIVMLDITRPGSGDRDHFLQAVEEISFRCFVPITAGGGIRKIEDCRVLFNAGADRICVNSEALARPAFISEISRKYGSQSVVISIDVKKIAIGRYEVNSQFGAVPTGRDPVDWAMEVEDRGAGEILVTSIDRDGSLEGYDIELNERIAGSVKIPVMINGGAGNWSHFVDGIIRGKADAVCTSNIYHFTETSIRSAKAYMSCADLAVRL